jgi:hypothetical protein
MVRAHTQCHGWVAMSWKPEKSYTFGLLIIELCACRVCHHWSYWVEFMRPAQKAGKACVAFSTNGNSGDGALFLFLCHATVFSEYLQSSARRLKPCMLYNDEKTDLTDNVQLRNLYVLLYLCNQFSVRMYSTYWISLLVCMFCLNKSCL